MKPMLRCLLIATGLVPLMVSPATAQCSEGMSEIVIVTPSGHTKLVCIPDEAVAGLEEAADHGTGIVATCPCFSTADLIETFSPYDDVACKIFDPPTSYRLRRYTADGSPIKIPFAIVDDSRLSGTGETIPARCSYNPIELATSFDLTGSELAACMDTLAGAAEELGLTCTLESSTSSASSPAAPSRQCPEGKTLVTIVNNAGKVVEICVPDGAVPGLEQAGASSGNVIPAACPCFSQEDVDEFLAANPHVSFIPRVYGGGSAMCESVESIGEWGLMAIAGPEDGCLTPDVFPLYDIQPNGCAFLPLDFSLWFATTRTEADACLAILRTFFE